MNQVETWPGTHPEQPETPDPRPTPAAADLPPAVVRKNPVLAAFLSLLPGIGNVYNGLYMRGITFFLVIVSLMAIAAEGHPFFGFAVAFFWLFNVIDAFRQATLINYGYAQDLGLLDMPRVPPVGQGGILAGVLLILIGGVALAERYLDVSLQWLFDLWPFALVVAGGWLVVASARDRRQSRRSEESSGL
jgi:hypothetical protein